MAHIPFAETSLDLCQELIIRLFLPNKELDLNYKSKSVDDELALIGV